MQMLAMIDEVERCVRKRIQDTGWCNITDELSLCTTLALTLHRIRTTHGVKTSLQACLDEVRDLSCCRSIPERDAVLALLSPDMDKPLLERSRDIISRLSNAWAIMAAKADPERLKPREHLRGIALVLKFTCEANLEAALQQYLSPIHECVVLSPLPHFTIASFGTDIPVAHVREICSAAKAYVSKATVSGRALANLSQTLRHEAKVRTSLHLLSDGAFVLFGSGESFWLGMHEFRTRMFEDDAIREATKGIADSNPYPIQPIWVQTSVARLAQRPSPQAMRLLPMWPPSTLDEKSSCLDAALALIVFDDQKAHIISETIILS